MASDLFTPLTYNWIEEFLVSVSTGGSNVQENSRPCNFTLNITSEGENPSGIINGTSPLADSPGKAPSLSAKYDAYE